MRLEFNQGVPEGCVEWLYENVGRGNITYIKAGLVRGLRMRVGQHPQIEDSGDYAWFYERVSIPVPLGDAEPNYFPTITVKDPKLAMWFVLRWSS